MFKCKSINSQLRCCVVSSFSFCFINHTNNCSPPLTPKALELSSMTLISSCFPLDDHCFLGDVCFASHISGSSVSGTFPNRIVCQIPWFGSFFYLLLLLVDHFSLSIWSISLWCQMGYPLFHFLLSFASLCTFQLILIINSCRAAL